MKKFHLSYGCCINQYSDTKMNSTRSSIPYSAVAPSSVAPSAVAPSAVAPLSQAWAHNLGAVHAFPDVLCVALGLVSGLPNLLERMRSSISAYPISGDEFVASVALVFLEAREYGAFKRLIPLEVFWRTISVTRLEDRIDLEAMSNLFSDVSENHVNESEWYCQDYAIKFLALNKDRYYLRGRDTEPITDFIVKVVPNIMDISLDQLQSIVDHVVDCSSGGLGMLVHIEDEDENVVQYVDWFFYEARRETIEALTEALEYEYGV